MTNNDMHHTSPIKEHLAMNTGTSLTLRQRLHLYVRELPEALSLAVLTAITTLMLAVVLSSFVGQGSESHRIASRCFTHETVALIHAIVSQSSTLSETIDLSQYPLIDISGIDCTTVYEGEEK